MTTSTSGCYLVHEGLCQEPSPALFMFAGCPKGETREGKGYRGGIDGVVPLGAGNTKKMMTDISEDYEEG